MYKILGADLRLLLTNIFQLMKFIALASVLTAVHATSSFDYVVIGGGTAYVFLIPF